MTERNAMRVAPPTLHLPSLLVACIIMLVGTLYPPALMGTAARPDHVFLTLLLCAMSTGFVRGVGLVPGPTLWRTVFSGWSCALCLIMAGAARILL